jgi:glycosyltransferase involved in cell wall biosynthesis
VYSNAPLTIENKVTPESTPLRDSAQGPNGPAILSIVIPALNEEESIGTTIQRCLDAREHIRRVGRVRDVEIIVVSDGSTDRTAEIARSFSERNRDVRVIVFEQNRGYGAAIKEGFARSTGTLVAFLDADGTCNPRVFGELCHAVLQDDAAIALGSRMGPGTRMPFVRRLGNTLYALLLGSLSGQAVSDTASGMRVIRRAALRDLYPLPDGLHFTPAMSARAMMSHLRIVEIPMEYAERVGESKLRVLRDGVRFLLAISDASLLYQPGRLFRLGALVCVSIAVVWAAYPVEFYWRNHRLEEWMIYRLLLSGLLSTCAFTLITSGALAERILSLVYRRHYTTFLAHVYDLVLERGRSLILAAIAFLSAIILVWPGLRQYMETGRVTVHWSRPIAAVFLIQMALIAIVHSIMRKIVDLWKSELTRHAAAEELEKQAASAPSSNAHHIDVASSNFSGS